MGKVIFTMYASLDGYVEDSNGSFDFGEPDDELHRLATEQAREASAFLFGRRLLEHRAFPSGAVCVRYERVSGGPPSR